MVNLILGLATMMLCLLLQAALALVALRYYSRHQDTAGVNFGSSLLVVGGVLLLLVATNLAQVAIWALLFVVLGEFTQIEEAIYHSAVNFATLGYGDIVMSEAHRILGPLQAINGVLMIGISTAALLEVIRAIVHQKFESSTG